jgi:hypothetical protein
MGLKFVSLAILFVLPVTIAQSTGNFELNSRSETLLDKLETNMKMTRDELPRHDLIWTALAGYESLMQDNRLRREHLLTLIDFSIPSDKKRLWVIDLSNFTILVHCYVSHGRNSGELYAEVFSNTPGSYTSSAGFYSTGETYIGKHGLSLYLDGLEEGINDKARDRAIVMHGADYVSEEFIAKHGRLGRSHGCPAVPVELNEQIIKTIKGGSCLYIHSGTDCYTKQSRLLRDLHSENLFSAG